MRDWIGFNKWLRASSHEPSWLGWLVNQDKFCLGFMWEISICVLKWEKGLKKFLAWFLRSYREKPRSQDPRPDHLFILTHQDFLRELGMHWDIENQACLISGAHMKRLYWLVKPNYQTPLSHIIHIGSNHLLMRNYYYTDWTNDLCTKASIEKTMYDIVIWTYEVW